nr:hypothetical protein [Alkalicoccobacillus murimartini]
MEILYILLPLIIVSAIVLFVIKRLQYKYKRGTLGKKKSKSSQILLDSLIPLGMLMGTIISMFLSMFSQINFLSAISLGPGIGFLFGYFAYEIFSKKEEASS